MRHRGSRVAMRRVEARALACMRRWRLAGVWRCWLTRVREPDMWTRRLQQVRPRLLLTARRQTALHCSKVNDHRKDILTDMRSSAFATNPHGLMSRRDVWLESHQDGCLWGCSG